MCMGGGPCYVCVLGLKKLCLDPENKTERKVTQAAPAIAKMLSLSLLFRFLCCMRPFIIRGSHMWLETA